MFLDEELFPKTYYQPRHVKNVLVHINLSILGGDEFKVTSKSLFGIIGKKNLNQIKVERYREEKSTKSIFNPKSPKFHLKGSKYNIFKKKK